MNAKKMIKLCKTARASLDDLEGLSPYIPEDQNATKFIYQSLIAVDELQNIAKWETITNVTVPQAADIHRILVKIEYLMGLIPDSIKNPSDPTDGE